MSDRFRLDGFSAAVQTNAVVENCRDVFRVFFAYHRNNVIDRIDIDCFLKPADLLKLSDRFFSSFYSGGFSDNTYRIVIAVYTHTEFVFQYFNVAVKRSEQFKNKINIQVSQHHFTGIIHKNATFSTVLILQHVKLYEYYYNTNNSFCT